jgi:hypothetical protein
MKPTLWFPRGSEYVMYVSVIRFILFLVSNSYQLDIHNETFVASTTL